MEVKSGREAEDGVDSLLALFFEINITLMIQNILNHQKIKRISKKKIS